MTCGSCGGVLGKDCFNAGECAQINQNTDKIREEAFLEADSFYRQRKDAWDVETRQKERARLIVLAQDLMVEIDDDEGFGDRARNQALSDFIEQAKL